jgi:Cu/Ag efflux pump CusA
MLLPGAVERHRASPLVRGLQAIYRAILPRLIHRPGFAVLVLVLAFAASGWAIMGLGQQLLPNFKETDFLMHFVEKPGTSLAAMTRITEDASKELMAIKGVKNFGSHIGRAEVADEVVVVGPNFTELWISIDEKAPYKETVGKIEDAINGYPGLTATS